MQGEAASVVHKEKWPAVLDVVMDRAHAEFVPDTVTCPHEFRICKRRKFIGSLNGDSSGRFIDATGNVV